MNQTDQINQKNQRNQIAQSPNNLITELPSHSITGSTSQWYVVQTKPCNEHRVETNLSNQEIEAFLPLCENFQYAQGRLIEKIKPLFPNYLFAKLDIEAHYYKVKWTRGVSKILGVGGGPIPISEKVVLAIKERMGESNLVRLDDGWVQGSVVQFTSGPFKDLTGVFDKKMSDGKRVKVLLNLIGVDVPVQVSKYQIKKVA